MKKQLSAKRIMHSTALLAGAAAMVTASVTGCKKGEKDSTGLACDFRQEMTVLLQVQESYDDTPNRSTCNAYKDAALKLRTKIKDCPVIEQQLSETMKADIETYRNFDCNAAHPE